MLFLETNTASQIELIIEKLLEQSVHLGVALIKAFIIFIIGRLLISLINKFVKRIMIKRNIDLSVRSFVGSLVNVLLIILLIISVVGALGIQTTSFAALIASAGVGIGMALSGNLSNFAGGLMILLFKPFKVGDFISNNDMSGTVESIQIFHTVLNTSDNIKVYVPNGSLSSGLINNFNVSMRRVEWTFGVDYGVNFETVKSTINSILSEDERILKDPPSFVALKELAESSVNIVVRAWVYAPDYWGVYFDINRLVYETFNDKGINFPFAQITIHKADDENS